MCRRRGETPRPQCAIVPSCTRQTRACDESSYLDRVVFGISHALVGNLILRGSAHRSGLSLELHLVQWAPQREEVPVLRRAFVLRHDPHGSRGKCMVGADHALQLKTYPDQGPYTTIKYKGYTKTAGFIQNLRARSQLATHSTQLTTERFSRTEADACA